MKLERKVAVVTGGARGIGAAICRRYADEGARVAVADILADEAEALAREIGRGAFAVPLDVTRRASIDAHGRARRGGAQAASTFWSTTPRSSTWRRCSRSPRASYDKQFAVNVKGLLFTLQAVAAQMVKQGRGGKIVNFSSQAGRRGEPLVAVYCASKAAVISLTQSAGLALIKHEINVNAIAPGVVDTPMWDQVDALFARYEGLPVGEKKRRVGLAVPYGRMGTPEDITGAAVFLASSDADYVVAQTLNVDGGNWMS